MQALGRPDTGATTTDQPEREPLRWLARVLLIVTLLLVGIWAVQRTTWYLAIDQFGYLTFAEDLSHGHALHEWPLDLVMKPVLPLNADVDVYSQTYVRRGDQLFCRYSPGFPLILALVRLLFGPDAQHVVNPIALVLLLACVFALARRSLSSEWLALGATLLVALLPNYILLWSTSPLRDVPAHFMALAGLCLLLPGGTLLRSGWREAVAAALLGFAITTRVDAVLYLIPAGALALQSRELFLRRLAMGLAGLLLGVAPLLGYNYVATGNPLRPTQAMEASSVLSRAPSANETRGRWSDLLPGPRAAVAAPAPAATPAVSGPTPRLTPFLVQGGGLRVSHLGRTLPANVAILRGTFGDLGLALALVGAIAAVRSRPLFLLVVPYTVVAFFFFSLWTLPAARYLTGILLLLPLLVVYGARAIATVPAALVARGRPALGLPAAITLTVLVLIALAVQVEGVPSALPWVSAVLAASVALGAFAGVVSGGVRPTALVAIALGLGLSTTLLWRSTSSLGTYASFQRDAVERARKTVAGAIEERSVVLTTTKVGRPAENLNYYTGAEAVYLEELDRWQAPPRFMISRFLRNNFAVYLLLPPLQVRDLLEDDLIEPFYVGEVVRSIPAEQAIDYFVASPYHRGIPLQLVRMRFREKAS